MRHLFGVVGFILLAALPLPTSSQPVPAGALQSLYVPMGDETLIAVDVWLPSGEAAGFPALLNATRYWRGIQNVAEPSPEVAAFNAAGYAVVVMDVRGTGASGGTEAMPWSDTDVADMRSVIDWIVGQPWSNGRVGAYGVSYAGVAAELSAATAHPALRAVALQFSWIDLLADMALPGGVYNELGADWQAFNEALDRNDACALAPIIGLDCATVRSFTPGVRNVDDDPDRRLVDAFVRQRTNNVDVAAMIGTEVRETMEVGGETIDSVSPFRRRAAIESSGVPMFVQVGWLDADTVDGALSRYLTFENPQHLVIGPWSHGGRFQTDPFAPAEMAVEPPVEQQNAALVAFFDRYLKDDQEPQPSEITYYTMNAGTWSTSPTWPPEGFQVSRWYFGPDRHLSNEPPTGPGGADDYAVDFSATTGTASRWHSVITNGDVVYPDRAGEDGKLIVYTSDPLDRDIEITGNPLVTLYVSSTEPDAAFHVYLEDVAPDGRVTYITEGILPALHRQVDTDPPYVTVGPYHSLARAAAAPLAEGEVAEIRLSLYATSVLLEEGHRIRVAIAGANADAFRRYPAEATPVLSIQRNPVQASSIELPWRAVEGAP